MATGDELLLALAGLEAAASPDPRLGLLAVGVLQVLAVGPAVAEAVPSALAEPLAGLAQAEPSVVAVPGGPVDVEHQTWPSTEPSVLAVAVEVALAGLLVVAVLAYEVEGEHLLWAAAEQPRIQSHPSCSHTRTNLPIFGENISGLALAVPHQVRPPLKHPFDILYR